jgi:hypothetical protein
MTQKLKRNWIIMTVPMVLVLDRYNDGFLGLNLHYLPFQYRIAFLGKLMKFADLNDA